MNDGDNEHPDLPAPGPRAGCLVALVLLMIALPFLLCYFLLAPSPWKTEIGKVKLGNGTTLHVGTMYDVDIACDYYVKVRGKDGKHAEWTHFASSVIPAGDCESAVTTDSRFAGIAVRKSGSRELDGMVIYDAVEDELWWRAEGQWRSNGKFVRAWKELRKVNPQLPEAPY